MPQPVQTAANVLRLRTPQAITAIDDIVFGVNVQPSTADLRLGTHLPSFPGAIQTSLSIATTAAALALSTATPTPIIDNRVAVSAVGMALTAAPATPVLESVTADPDFAALALSTAGPVDDPPPGTRSGDTHDRSGEFTARYATTSHGDEAHMEGLVGAGDQMRWSDIQDANGDPTLGERFAHAMTQLEGMCYAVWGGRPNYDEGEQWHERLNQRCIWFGESWEQQARDDLGNDYDYNQDNKELSALGQSPFPQGVPTVPKRSRSGDPDYQFAERPHNDSLFPTGSILRTAGQYHDPISTTQFGASAPTPEDVVIQYNAQPDVSYTSVRLEYQLKPPGGSWGSHTTLAMTPSGSTYTATIPAQEHETECRWRIAALYVDPELGALEQYDPNGPDDGETPEDDEQYSFVWFTHYSPYDNGLPEMLDSYGPAGIQVRKGTDWYRFDQSETIQPELITLARFTLDALTQGRPFPRGSRYASMHHSPRLRGALGECCQYMPIRWRWSGSSPHPHYVRDGKGGNPATGGTVGVHPLHNAPNENPPSGETWGFTYSRMSWRGIDMLYKEPAHFNNYFYGEGNSWESPPEEYVVEFDGVQVPARVYEKFPLVGLRSEDVIDAVHIEEIIAAVDYLIRYGCWYETPIFSLPRTPGTYLDRECGLDTILNIGPDGTFSQDRVTYCEKCCVECDGIVTNTYYPDGSESHNTTGTPDCTPHPTPTWEECWNTGAHGKCGMSFGRSKSCQERGPYEDPDGNPVPAEYQESTTEHTRCDEGTGSGCGTASASYQCVPGDEFGNPYLHNASCGVFVMGWSAYFCGPPKCLGGPDSDHGNGLVKLRYDHSSPFLNIVSSGTPGMDSQGNCRGDIKLCGEDAAVGIPTDLYFEELIGHVFNGLATPWESACNCGDPCGSIQPYPDIPGLSGWQESCCDVNFNTIPCDLPNAQPCPLCRITQDDFQHLQSVACTCNIGSLICRGEAAWVAIDLNLDGGGRPYIAYPGRPSSPSGPFEGDAIPYLRPYDMDAEVSGECPCETWTGLTPCA